MWRRALAVFVFAVGVRLLVVAAIPGWDMPTDMASGLSGDELDYSALAANLAHGKGYVLPWHGRGPHSGELRPTAFRAPLWPALLAGLYRVTGTSRFAARLLNVALDGLTCALLVPLGALLWRPRTGVVAGAIAAIYPPLWVNVFRIHSEVSFTTALVLALLLAERLRRRPSLPRAGALGLALGAVALGRPNGLLVAVALAWWAAATVRSLGRRTAFAIGGTCVGAAALLVGPWMLWSSVALGEAVPITTQGGSVLGGYYSPAMLDRARPDWGSWDFFRVIRAYADAPDEATFDRGLQGAGRRWIAGHPAGTLRLIGMHVQRYFDLYWELKGRRTIVYYPTRYDDANMAVIVSWWLAAGLAGAAVWRLRSRLAPFVPALITFGALAFSGVMFGASTRFRAPAEPVVVLLGATLLTSRLHRVDRVATRPAPAHPETWTAGTMAPVDPDPASSRRRDTS
jgi:hypothetical protein